MAEVQLRRDVFGEQVGAGGRRRWWGGRRKSLPIMPLPHFGTKEDAVLAAFDGHDRRVADALRARPADEDDWTALRRALDAVIGRYHEDPAGALATTRLVRETPALCARQLEKQHGWRPALAGALAERSGTPESVGLGHTVRAAAALDCLNVALDHWTASDGRLDLVTLLDEAFAALAPTRAPESR
ncbi:TetR family transcriptional regulator [Streptomyces sp. NPDC058676]|uniref:acyl-CoA-like ligand-binding transcription factor n=1 Tax=unclassified Streptomyces TaxID=2593676 RepID=UPI003663E88B